MALNSAVIHNLSTGSRKVHQLEEGFLDVRKLDIPANTLYVFICHGESQSVLVALRVDGNGYLDLNGLPPDRYPGTWENPIYIKAGKGGILTCSCLI
ncbi:g11932 [Coccomyxa viridis]|uniref:G11932 protein n=1 Tax=Coccomyxa viridis TaxID=1274662 RepID=A0ABP1G9G0_9CHLO